VQQHPASEGVADEVCRPTALRDECRSSPEVRVNPRGAPVTWKVHCIDGAGLREQLLEWTPSAGVLSEAVEKDDRITSTRSLHSQLACSQLIGYGPFCHER
jgi:hypothetical protein